MKPKSVLNVLPGYTKERAKSVAEKTKELLKKYAVGGDMAMVSNATVIQTLMEFEDRQDMAIAATYIMYSMKKALNNPLAAIIEMIMTDEDEK